MGDVARELGPAGIVPFLKELFQSLVEVFNFLGVLVDGREDSLALLLEVRLVILVVLVELNVQFFGREVGRDLVDDFWSVLDECAVLWCL